MAGSRNYQVNVGGFADPTAPLRNALSTIQAGVYRRKQLEEQEAAKRLKLAKGFDVQNALAEAEQVKGPSVIDVINNKYTEATNAYAADSARLKEALATSRRDTIAAGLAAKTVEEGSKITQYDNNGKPIETPESTILKQQKAKLDADYNGYISKLNAELTTRSAVNPNFLDTKPVDIEGQARNIYNNIVRKTGDTALAKQYHDNFLATNQGSNGEIDYDLIKVLQKQKDTIIGDAQTVTTTDGNSGGNSSGSYASATSRGKGNNKVFTGTTLGGEYLKKMLGDSESTIGDFFADGKASGERLIEKLVKETGASYAEAVNAIASTAKMSKLGLDRKEYDEEAAKKFIVSGEATKLTAPGYKTNRPKSQIKVKQKQYTKTQKEQIHILDNQIARALNRSGGTRNISVRDVLGDKFIGANPDSFTPKNLKEALKTFKGTKKEKTTLKNLFDNIETTNPNTMVKTKEPTSVEADVTIKDNVGKLEEVAKDPKVKITPKTPEVVDTAKAIHAKYKDDPEYKKEVAKILKGEPPNPSYWDRVLTGAKIKYTGAKADPVGTVWDLGLGVANALPALVSAIGDLSEVDTPMSDSITKFLKSKRSDNGSLGFDLAEAVGATPMSGITKSTIKGAAKTPIIGTPARLAVTGGKTGGKLAEAVAYNTGKTVAKGASITKKVKKLLTVDVKALKDAERAKKISEIRELIRTNKTDVTTVELKRLQRKLKALTNAKKYPAKKPSITKEVAKKVGSDIKTVLTKKVGNEWIPGVKRTGGTASINYIERDN